MLTRNKNNKYDSINIHPGFLIVVLNIYFKNVLLTSMTIYVAKSKNITFEVVLKLFCGGKDEYYMFLT